MHVENDRVPDNQWALTDMKSIGGLADGMSLDERELKVQSCLQLPGLQKTHQKYKWHLEGMWIPAVAHGRVGPVTRR